MNVQHPLVSVIVPAYNAARDLSATLESVRLQSLREFEVLIVNDGSADGTAAIAMDFARRDPRFRLIEQDNGGVGEARNHAVREARGDYIAPLDSDDRWHPDKLAKQVACMESAGPETGLVYCWSRKVNRDGRVLGVTYPYRVSGYHPHAMLLRNFAGNSSVPLIRASALREVGPYLTRADQEGIQGCEDWDLHIRVAERHLVDYVGEYLVDYLQTATCLSLDWEGMTASGVFVLRRARERNLDLSPTLFRWSTGHFHCYLSNKCYRWGDYAGALQSARFALQADPVNVFNRQLRGVIIRSTARLLARRSPHGGVVSPSPDRPPARPAASHFFGRIESRRWAHVLSTPHPENPLVPLSKRRPVVSASLLAILLCAVPLHSSSGPRSRPSARTPSPSPAYTTAPALNFRAAEKRLNASLQKNGALATKRAKHRDAPFE